MLFWKNELFWLIFVGFINYLVYKFLGIRQIYTWVAVELYQSIRKQEELLNMTYVV